MSKFYIGAQKDEPITEIVWINEDGVEESIVEEGDAIAIYDDCSCARIYVKDIPKLEAALAKARELGWFE